MAKTVLSLLVGALAFTCAAHPPAPKPTPGPSTPKSYLNFTTVTGFFAQDDPATDPAKFDYTAFNFGLLNRTYPTDSWLDKVFKPTQWQRFERYVGYLNLKSGRDSGYKVLFMGRHGEGYHNAAESYFGTPAWNCYWSLLDGNATVTWADALVTPEGVRQAKVAEAYWLSRIKLQKIPLPDVYYSSPLSRCLETARLTFAKLPLPWGHKFVPTVKEFLREGISGHTCDRRRTKTYIKNTYPGYNFEKGFTEKDELFKPLFAEVSVDQDIRSKHALDDILGVDKDTWISITSHSGEIASLLRVLKHQVFRLSTGAIIPVLVKVDTIHAAPTPTTTLPWSQISTCATAPTTAAPAP